MKAQHTYVRNVLDRRQPADGRVFMQSPQLFRPRLPFLERGYHTVGQKRQTHPPSSVSPFQCSIGCLLVSIPLSVPSSAVQPELQPSPPEFLDILRLAFFPLDYLFFKTTFASSRSGSHGRISNQRCQESKERPLQLLQFQKHHFLAGQLPNLYFQDSVVLAKEQSAQGCSPREG